MYFSCVTDTRIFAMSLSPFHVTLAPIFAAKNLRNFENLFSDSLTFLTIKWRHDIQHNDT
jgi:hypothetical protein